MTTATERPRHRCGARTDVVTRLDDGGRPFLVLWCPACDTVAPADENDPPRGIDVDDLTQEDMTTHVSILKWSRDPEGRAS
jgi:hypothetical protein